MQQWLALTQTDEDKQRLKAMGNCVVPMMARVAISTLGRIIKLDPGSV